MNNSLGPNAMLVITILEDGSLRFEWQGGDILAVSVQLIEDSYSGFVELNGDELQIGPFYLKVIDRYDPGYGEVIIAKRVCVKQKYYGRWAITVYEWVGV
jgi:hypothetical protein